MKITADLIECPKCGNRAVELKAFLKDKWLETYDIEAYCDKCVCYFWPGEKPEDEAT